MTAENVQALCDFIDSLSDVQILVVPSMHDQRYSVRLDVEVLLNAEKTTRIARGSALR